MKEHSYDDGNYYAATLGHFISLLVDSGQDPAVIYRVVGDSKHTDDGRFMRMIEVTLLPDGMVGAAIEEMQPVGIHKTLKTLIEGGVVE